MSSDVLPKTEDPLKNDNLVKKYENPKLFTIPNLKTVETDEHPKMRIHIQSKSKKQARNLKKKGGGEVKKRSVQN